jgi:hypothetical protein
MKWNNRYTRNIRATGNKLNRSLTHNEVTRKPQKGLPVFSRHPNNPNYLRY